MVDDTAALAVSMTGEPDKSAMATLTANVLHRLETHLLRTEEWTARLVVGGVPHVAERRGRAVDSMVGIPEAGAIGETIDRDRRVVVLADFG